MKIPYTPAALALLLLAAPVTSPTASVTSPTASAADKPNIKLLIKEQKNPIQGFMDWG